MRFTTGGLSLTEFTYSAAAAVELFFSQLTGGDSANYSGLGRMGMDDIRGKFTQYLLELSQTGQILDDRRLTHHFWHLDKSISARPSASRHPAFGAKSWPRNQCYFMSGGVLTFASEQGIFLRTAKYQPGNYMYNFSR